jgi:fatty acyl-CoA reductase
VYADSNCVLDLIPVDIAVNSVITSAWYVAMERPKDVLVVHCASGHLNPLPLGKTIELINVNVARNPLNGCIIYPSLVGVETRFMNRLYWFLYTYLPALTIDTLLRIRGEKTRMVRVQKKVTEIVTGHEFFMNNEWTFTCNNMIRLHEAMSLSDRKTFVVDIRKVHWDEYFHDYQIGLRQYLFKEPLDSIQKAKSHVFRLKLLSTMLRVGFVAFILRLVLTRWTTAGLLTKNILQMLN